MVVAVSLRCGLVRLRYRELRKVVGESHVLRGVHHQNEGR